MIISDLEHLEVIAEGNNVVGSGTDTIAILNADVNKLLASLGLKQITLSSSSNPNNSKIVYSKKTGDSKKGSNTTVSVSKNGNSVTATKAAWNQV